MSSLFPAHGNEKEYAVKVRGAHLIIPEEARVERRATIICKEVSETSKDIPILKRFEHGKDDVKVPRPVTAPTARLEAWEPMACGGAKEGQLEWRAGKTQGR